MKITKVLVSCDSHGDYASMFPLVHKMWKSICDYDCIAIYVGTSLPAVLENFKNKFPDSVILYKPLPNIHTTFQAQCIRLLYPALMENETVLISDMDIVPLKKQHFVELLDSYNKENFVTYTDRYVKQKMFAMCYNAAHCSVWQTIFNVKKIDDISTNLIQWYKDEYTGSKNCIGWFTDQEKLYSNAIKYDKIIILNDMHTNYKRLDKKQKKFILENKQVICQSIHNYSDFHFIRPYSKFHKIINNIALCAVNNSNKEPFQDNV